MNAADILGELLRGGGKGGGIFNDIFGQAASPGRQPAGAPPSAGDVASQAKELEDLIGVGSSQSRPAPVPRQAPPATRWDAPAPTTRIPQRLPEAPLTDPVRQDAEATILIRAMINAAKADGQLSPEEQKALIDQMGGASPEAIRFLQQEIQQQTNVRDFAWSVPLGMEAKVYMITLSAVTIDTAEESAYLEELAHGLRLPREVRNHIHQQFGLPPVSAGIASNR